MNTHPQDDLVIVFALDYLSRQFIDDYPVLAEHSRELAIDFADLHGLGVEDAIRNLAYFGGDWEEVTKVLST